MLQSKFTIYYRFDSWNQEQYILYRQECCFVAKPGSPGSPGKKGIKGSPGYLAVRFVNFRTQKWRHIRIPSSGGKYDFEMKDIKVDLSRSIITMDTKTSDIAQNLCLAFSISVLQVRDISSSSLFLHLHFTAKTLRIMPECVASDLV